jgi:hypothetical protein
MPVIFAGAADQKISHFVTDPILNEPNSIF